MVESAFDKVFRAYIRRRYESGETLTHIAKEFSMSKQYLSLFLIIETLIEEKTGIPHEKFREIIMVEKSKGMKLYALAKKYGLPLSEISLILNGLSEKKKHEILSHTDF